MQALAQAHDQAHIVIDDQEAESAGLRQGLQKCKQFAGFRLVHAGGRLVEQQVLGVGGQRSGDLHAALVAVAEAGCQILAAPIQPELGEQIARLAPR